MVTTIRNQIMADLGIEFSREQLQMIDMAVAKALTGYKIEPMETLPMPYEQVLPREAEEWLVRKKMKGCSAATLETYHYIISEFCSWLHGKPIRKVKDTDILMFLAACSGKGAGNHTLDNKRRALRSFFTFLHNMGYTPSNPALTIDPISYPVKVIKPLSDMELELIRQACDTPRDTAMIEVIYSTGCRVSEVVGMNRTDINRGTRSVIVCGKGSKERHVYFTARALIAIDNYLATRHDDNPALFVSERKPYQRIQKPTIERQFRLIGQKTGIGKRIHPHLLRHTLATDMLTHGARIDEVSTILGHANINTTRIYAKNSERAIAHAHRMCIG